MAQKLLPSEAVALYYKTLRSKEPSEDLLKIIEEQEAKSPPPRRPKASKRRHAKKQVASVNRKQPASRRHASDSAEYQAV